jgi:hypothetical protein
MDVAERLDAVDLRDVRMVERSEQLRLALEAGPAVVVIDEVCGRTLIATSRLSLVSCAR